MLRVVVCWRYEARCEYSDEDARQSHSGNEDRAACAGIVDEEAFWVCACFDMAILESAARSCYSRYSFDRGVSPLPTSAVASNGVFGEPVNSFGDGVGGAGGVALLFEG